MLAGVTAAALQTAPAVGQIGQLIAGIGLGAGGAVWALKTILSLVKPASNGNGTKIDKALYERLDRLQREILFDLQKDLTGYNAALVAELRVYNAELLRVLSEQHGDMLEELRSSLNINLGNMERSIASLRLERRSESR
jgi:hypothetical protein